MLLDYRILPVYLGLCDRLYSDSVHGGMIDRFPDVCMVTVLPDHCDQVFGLTLLKPAPLSLWLRLGSGGRISSWADKPMSLDLTILTLLNKKIKFAVRGPPIEPV